jgi:hypothetical protein
MSDAEYLPQRVNCGPIFRVTSAGRLAVATARVLKASLRRFSPLSRNLQFHECCSVRMLGFIPLFRTENASTDLVHATGSRFCAPRRKERPAAAGIVEQRVSNDRKRRSMRIVDSFRLAGFILAVLSGGVQPASAQGTELERQSCTPDVFRVCGAYIPDAKRIAACLRANGPRLSPACYAVFFDPSRPNRETSANGTRVILSGACRCMKTIISRRTGATGSGQRTVASYPSTALRRTRWSSRSIRRPCR